MNNPFSSGYNMPDNCFSTPYDEPSRCSVCECEIDEDDDFDGMCEECYEEYMDEHSIECDFCGQLRHEDSVSKFEGYNLCDNCRDDKDEDELHSRIKEMEEQNEKYWLRRVI